MSGPIELPPGKGPGKWMRILVDEFDPQKRRWGALIRCPGECGRVLAVINHTIASNGQVTPSVGHPEGYPPCSWHVTPRLLGWDPVPELPPLPAPTFCERCHRMTYQLGQWGTWSGGTGLICPECIRAHIASAQRMSTDQEKP